MTGNEVPDSDHISRYSGGSHVKSDGTLSGAAFRLRKERNEEYLSVNWLEFLEKENRLEEIKEIQKILAAKFRTVGSKAKIAVLNVGKMRGDVQTNSDGHRILRVLHQPETNDPSHSGIYDLRLDDDLVADLIAQSIKETHPAKGG
jgi:hypothetical protein